MTLPIMFSRGAEASICWTKHKKELSDLVENSAFYEKQLQQAAISPDILIKLAKNFSGTRNVKSNCDGRLTYNQREKLNAAEKVQDKLLLAVERKIKHYFGVEQKIAGEIERQFGNDGKTKSSEQIFELLHEYTEISRFAPLYGEESLGKSFYLDLTKATEFISPTSYTAILSQYASSNTKEELQQAQQSLGKNVWKEVEAEKERLLQKYSGKLSKAETEFIKALPGKKWRELDAEMSKVVAHADEYLGKRREIEKEIQFVRKDMTGLLSAESIPECIAKITSKSLVNRSFNEERNIYLKESFAFYEQEVQRREKVRGEKQKFVKLKLEEQFRELDTAFDGEKALELSIMNEYGLKAAKLHQYYQRAGLDYSSVSGFEDKLTRIKSHLISFPTAKPKIIYGEVIVKEEAAVKVSVKEVSTPLPPVENIPEVKPIIAPEVEYSFQRPLDLTNFADDYHDQAVDSRLAKLCRQVAGVQDNGELLLVGLSERLRKINRKELIDLGAALSGKDVQAYQLLKGGVEKYGCGLM